MAGIRIEPKLRIVSPVFSSADKVALTTREKTVSVTGVGTNDSAKTAELASVKLNNDQVIKVMIVTPSKVEKWTWSQIAKYTAYATGVGALAYYGYSQLWDVAKEVPEVIKTVHNVVTKGIPSAVKSAKTAIKSSQVSYHALGAAIAGAREVLNKVRVPTILGVPPAKVPQNKEDTIQLGTEFVNNGWVGAGAAAANAAYLAPIWGVSILAFGKPGKASGMVALGALTLETAVPGSIEKISEFFDKTITSLRETYHETPGLFAAGAAVGAATLFLAVKNIKRVF